MLLHLRRVVVADDELDRRLLGTGGDLRRVDEALALLRRLGRAAVARQLGDEIGCELRRVHELPLRGARVGRTAPDRDRHLGGVEGLRLDLSQLGAVERVRELGSVALELEMVGAAGDLLVDGEADANRSVLEVGVPLQVRDGGHDLRDAGLVVCAEQRRAVGRDDVVTELLLQQRQLLGVEHDARVAGQRDHAAVVALVDLRLDIGSGHVRRGVDMRDQPDRRRDSTPGSDP